jgi:hypothetical protein
LKDKGVDFEERFDVLVQKEALGKITEEEARELEQIQVSRDKKLLGEAQLERMEEEQQASINLVSAFERYAKATQSRLRD